MVSRPLHHPLLSSLLRLLLMVLIAVAVGSEPSSATTNNQSMSDPRSSSDEVYWNDFAEAAVRSAPTDAHLVFITPSGDGPASRSMMAASQAAWSVLRDTVHLACGVTAAEVMWGPDHRLDEAGALSHRNKIVLMLCSLEEVIRLLEEVAKKSLEVVWLRWVILTTTHDIAVALQPLLRTGAQVTVVERQRRGEKYVIITSGPHPDYTMRLTQVGSWFPGSSPTHLQSMMYPPPNIHYKNMKGRVMRVAVVNNWPFFGFIEHEDGTATPTSGIDHSIVEAVGNVLNFTFRVVPSIDGQWGGVQPDGSVSGMIGMVARHEVDFAIDEITITGAREKVVDFTHPYHTESTVLLNLAPKEANRALAVFSPFSKTVWGSLVVVTVAMSVAVYLLQNVLEIQARSLEQRHRIRHTPALEVLFNMYRSVVIQGNRLEFDHFVLRSVLVTWYLFCLIVYALYAGTLTASLASPTLEKPINSLEELLMAADAGRFKPAVPKGTSMEVFFNSAEEGSLYHGIGKAAALVTTLEEGIDMVQAGTGIYMAGQTALELKATLRGRHKFYIGRDRFYMQSYAAVCSSGSPLKIQLDSILGRLVAAGLIQKWVKQEVARVEVVREVDAATDRALTMIHLQGAFILYMLGMSSAVIGLIVELVFHKTTKSFGGGKP